MATTDIQETAHYGLVEIPRESTDVTFRDFRDYIAGSGKNMTKIDNAIYSVDQKAESLKSMSVDYTLTAANWSNGIYTLTDENITAADSNGTIGLAQSATTEQWESCCMAKIRIVGQAEGSITLTADGATPTVDIPVTLTIIK